MSEDKVDWERAPHSIEAYEGAPVTAHQLRNDIHKSKVGSATTSPEPAASPLGTDDEAAGTPASEDRLEMAMKAEQKIIAAAKRRS